MTDAERIANLERFAHDMADRFWRFQGRLNALELTVTSGTLNFAKIQENPFQFVQEYVEAMRQTTKSLLADVDDPGKADRLTSETRDAMDELLAQLLQSSGQLKGAPGKRG
ncbi:hypothetical protein [Bradyrhizobium sp. SZCCHNRI2007]|uniref:hypothetical protein n=1 Tax=Bradyrhizobium sp. SZCCHNRI2007 TaxID=3057281 RepID=UPI0028E8423B|nr:hypothetical protein [Bradyrhizobium sp. SZCCHNRI2007]